MEHFKRYPLALSSSLAYETIDMCWQNDGLAATKSTGIVGNETDGEGIFIPIAIIIKLVDGHVSLLCALSAVLADG